MASELSRLIEDELKNKGYYHDDKEEEEEHDLEAPHAMDEHRALIGALRVEARVKEQNAQKHLHGLKRALCIGGGLAIVVVVWIVLVLKSNGNNAMLQKAVFVSPDLPTSFHSPPLQPASPPDESLSAANQSSPLTPSPMPAPSPVPAPQTVHPPPAQSASPPAAVTPKSPAPESSKPTYEPPPSSPIYRPPNLVPSPPFANQSTSNSTESDSDYSSAVEGDGGPPPPVYIKSDEDSGELKNYEDYEALNPKQDKGGGTAGGRRR